MKTHHWLLGAAAVGLVSASAETSDARVVSFDIESQGPAYDGKTFGEAGAYRRIDAVARLAIDPKSERGQRIALLDKAPVNERGEVEFSTKVTILAPQDAARGSGTLFYEVPNRGRNLAFPLINLTSAPASVATNSRIHPTINCVVHI